ncbi:MAG: DarT ssDNA thymidine ADP-ribosyltransferase family protein [Terrisporobacter sp.]
MGYKKDWGKIKEHVEKLKQEHKFKGLYHFTDFTNLRNVFDSGYLYSRNDCRRNNIEFVDGANHDVLDKAPNDVHEKVRFYYRGKTPTLYDNEGVKLEQYCDEVHIPMPVYLLFDEELLYLDDTEFSNGNATTSNIGSTANFFNTMDWDTIFHSTWFYPEERDYIVNKRHAELLSYNPVLIKKYLKKIIFRCEADKKRAINIYGHNNKYEVDINLFSDKNTDEARNDWQKNNFIRNYNIDYEYDEYGNKNTLVFRCEFQKILSNYKARFDIEDEDGVKYSDYVKELIDTVEKYYIDQTGKKTQERQNCKIVVVKIRGNIESYKNFSVYINDHLYIEEKLKKCEIEKYKIEIKNIDLKDKCILRRKFKCPQILKHNHKYEVFDSNNNLLGTGIIDFGNNEKDLHWDTTFNNYNENWYKIKYYIDDVMYICDLIHSKNMNYATE